MRWRIENVENSHFYTNKDIDRLIRETEGTFTQDLESGDRQRAMKRLRVPPLGEQQSPWTTFKVGLFSGAFVVLLVAVILTGRFTNLPWQFDGNVNQFPVVSNELMSYKVTHYCPSSYTAANWFLQFKVSYRNFFHLKTRLESHD